MRGHFLPREQYTPECRKGLGQDVSSADEIGIALMAAGDISKHLSVAVAPIVLSTNGTCSGGAPRIDGDRLNTVLRRQTFDPLPHRPIRPRGGGFAGDSGATTMWTAKNRGRYDRSKLRYPSDLTDEEWTHVEPLIPPAKGGGNRRRINVREVVKGIMSILSTGCQWRASPKDLPPRSTVFDYLDLWSRDGTLDRSIMRSTLNAATAATTKRV
jgi:Putative transposase of IS4/5 family (DUF4096)